MKLKIILPHKVSTNQLYGMYFRKRGNIVNDFHYSVKIEVMERKLKPITDYPVKCVYSFYLVKNLYDVINVSGMAKCIEDGLRACKILEQDSSKFVNEITLKVSRSSEKYDYCYVEFIKN